MNHYTDDEIDTILKSYKNKKENYKAWYDKIKDTDEWKEKNRARAREHYANGYKEKKAEDYESNKELNRAKNSFRYYKNNGRIDDYKKKYPDRYDMLYNINYCSLRDNNPSSSTTISDES